MDKEIVSAPAAQAGEAGPAELAGVTIPQRELRLLLTGLRTWYEESSRGGPTASLGLLAGEPGSGKSLLLAALQGGLRRQRLSSYPAACFAGDAPLEPLRQLLLCVLRDRLSLPAQGSGAPAPGSPWDRIQPLLPELCRLLPEISWPERAEPFPSLGRELDRLRITDVVAQTLALLAVDSPLCIFLEDLHRIDPLSRDALEALLRIAAARARDHRPPHVLIVATLRPAEAQGLEELLRRPVAFRVDVRGYSREDLRDHVLSVGLHLPLTGREALFKWAGGSPLRIQFALSAARAGEGAAPWGEGRAGEVWERFVAARFGLLAERDRRVLAALAAFGRPCPRSLLGAISDAAPPSPGPATSLPGSPAAPPAAAEALEAALHRLAAQGWVRAVGDDGGEPAWALSGEPLALPILAALPPEARAAVHGDLAAALLRGIEEHGAAGPGAPRPSLAQLFRYIRQHRGDPRLFAAGLGAAREAEDLAAAESATEVYERLTERLIEEGGSDRDLLAEIEERLAVLLEESGHFREALEVERRLSARGGASPEAAARRARLRGRLHGKLGERKLEAECYREALLPLRPEEKSLERQKLRALLARFSTESPEADEAFEDVKRLVDASRAGEKAAASLELYRLAQEACFRRGDQRSALVLEETVFELAGAAGRPLAILESAEHLGHLYLLHGDAAQATQRLDLAVERAGASGNRMLLARALAALGRLRRSTGSWREALSALRQARDLYEELGREQAVLDLHLSLAHLELYVWDFDAALLSLEAHASRAPHAGAGTGRRRALPPIYPDQAAREKAAAALRAKLATAAGARRAEICSGLADLLLDGGDQEEAGRLYEEALRAPETASNPQTLALILQRAGRRQRLLGERGRALRFFEKSLEHLGPAPDRALVGSAYLEVGGIFLVQGEAALGYDQLLRGLRLFLDIGDRQGIALTLLRVAEFLRETGLTAKAARFAEAAAELARHHELKRAEAEAQRFRGAVASESGDFVESARCFARSKSLALELALPFERAALELELGWESYRRESYPAALRTAREGIEAARQLGAQDLLEDFLFLLGAVESAVSNRSKNFLRALDVLNRALSGAQSRARPSVEAQVLLSIALIYRERGKVELAEEYRGRAGAIAERLASKLPRAVREAVEAARRPVGAPEGQALLATER